MTTDLYSVIRDGKYTCPVDVCDRRFHTLAEKKAHCRLKHDKPAKAKR